MDSANGPLPAAAKWGFRVALAIGCLALLFCFVNPLVAIFQSGLCFAFAFGIRRRRAWAAIGGAGFWLIPVAILLLSGNGLTADLLVTIAMSLAVGLLMLWAAGTLWREPAARSGSAPWIHVPRAVRHRVRLLPTISGAYRSHGADHPQWRQFLRREGHLETGPHTEARRDRCVPLSNRP
jgi:hypothetical protein